MSSSPRPAKARRPSPYGPMSPLVYFTMAAVIYHMWLSFTRHLWAQENNMVLSQPFMIMLGVDFWVVLILVATLWVSAVSRMNVPGQEPTVKRLLRRLLAPEWIMMALLFVWFLVCCAVYSDAKTDLITRDWRYVLDAAVIVLILMPLGMILGVRRTVRFLTTVLLVILTFATCFALVALVCVFSGRELLLPNGLAIRQSVDGDLYMGVNANIGAAIGLTMVYACLFLAVTRRDVWRWVFAGLAVPHLAVTILCSSRACYLALLVTMPAAAAFSSWYLSKRLRKLWLRLLIAASAAVLAYLLVWGGRELAAALYFSLKKKPSSGGERLFSDTGRLYIWRATGYLMTENPKQFFFGVPKLSYPTHIKRALTAVFGDPRPKGFAHAHNQLIQVGAVQGVPAMAVYFATWVMAAIRSLRVLISRRRREAMPGGWIVPVALLGMAIVNLFEPFVWLYFSAMSCLFYLFCGLLVAVDRGGGQAGDVPAPPPDTQKP